MSVDFGLPDECPLYPEERHTPRGRAFPCRDFPRSVNFVALRTRLCYIAPDWEPDREPDRETLNSMRTTRGLHKLSPLQVRRAPASGPGSVLSDGGGLYVRARLFVFRFTSPVIGEEGGKERDLSIGSVDTIALATARKIADGYRNLVATGIDPIEQRKLERQEARERAAKTRSLDSVLTQWLVFKGEPQAIARPLERYLKPIADRPMTGITSNDIADALEPLAGKPAMRAKVVSHVHSLFEWAMAKGIIDERLNPARLRKLNVLMPERTTAVRHHRFLALAELPQFMARLAEIRGTTARAFELLVHLGLRQAEIRALEWSFVDLPNRVITFPPRVMKAGRAHHVWLSDRALAIVMGMLPLRRPGGFVFPGRSSRGLSDRALRRFLETRFPEYRLAAAHDGGVQVHGTRSSLKTWGTTAGHRREIIETTLAHRVGGIVEASYLDFEDPAIRALRIKLYRAWSAFLTGKPLEDEHESAAELAGASADAPASNVVPLRLA